VQHFPKNIIHPIFRAWIQCTAYFYFEKVIVSGEENIPDTGPVILASNHPNSFLDPLLITSYYNRPIYYMARGDVFATRLASALLGFLNIIPIYRKEEGAENFPKNESTFTFCIKAFEQNGTVLIFSEGQSENEWELRPLRKGTARLAYDAWHSQGIGQELKILPVSINYSSWLHINCVAHLSFAPVISKSNLPEDMEQGLFHRKFNEQLKSELQEHCVVIDTEKQIELQEILVAFLLKNMINGKKFAKRAIEKISGESETEREKTILFANYIKTHNIKYFEEPSVEGFLAGVFIYPLAIVFNFIPYTICKFIATRTTHHNEFYDSVLFCTLLFIYPIYILALFAVTISITHSIVSSIAISALALLAAKWREKARRNIICFSKRKEMKTVSTMLRGLFEKGSD